MNSNINLNASDMRNLAELTVLLNVNVKLSVWLEGIYQANWKKEASSYMWRSNTNLIEIVHNEDYNNMVVCSSEELINSLKFVGA